MIKIPNINMPKSCFSCPCEQESFCGAMKKSIDYDQQPDKQRMDWCPLIEEDDTSTKGNAMDKTDNGWVLIGNNPNYSPFDGSGEYIFKCPECDYKTTKGTPYCPICGSKNTETTSTKGNIST